MSHVRHVAVLSSSTGAGTRAIIESVREHGHRASLVTPGEIGFETATGEISVDVEADVFLNWQSGGFGQGTLERFAVFQMLSDAGYEIINPPEAWLRTQHKALTQTSFASAESPPDTIETAYSSDARKTHTVRTERGGNGVIKPVMGGGGNGVSTGDKSRVFRRGDPGVYQRFVDTTHPDDDTDDHCDVRAFVVNDTVVAAMRRTATNDGEWRTNISRGGHGDEVSLSAEERDTAVEAVTATGVDVAGVDLITDAETDTVRVIEVNAPAGYTGLYEATGINVAKHIGAYAIKRAGGKPRESVSELSFPDKRETHPSRSEYASLVESQEVAIAGYDDSLIIPRVIDTTLDSALLTRHMAAMLGARLRSHQGTHYALAWCQADTASWREQFKLVDDIDALDEHTDAHRQTDGEITQAVFDIPVVPLDSVRLDFGGEGSVFAEPDYDPLSELDTETQ